MVEMVLRARDCWDWPVRVHSAQEALPILPNLDVLRRHPDYRVSQQLILFPPEHISLSLSPKLVLILSTWLGYVCVKRKLFVPHL